MSGDALGTCTTATPISLLMQATDECGNRRSLGGDLIEAVLMNKDEGTINIRVVDNSDGTYTLNFELDMPIEHELWISANGIREKARSVQFAPASARCRRRIASSAGSAAKDSCSPISRRCSFNRPTRVA